MVTADEVQAELNALKLEVAVFKADVDMWYLVVMGVLVFFMQSGFALLEAGSVRAKNTKNILMKNLLDACIGALVFWAFGYSLAVRKPSSRLPHASTRLCSSWLSCPPCLRRSMTARRMASSARSTQSIRRLRSCGPTTRRRTPRTTRSGGKSVAWATPLPSPPRPARPPRRGGGGIRSCARVRVGDSHMPATRTGSSSSSARRPRPSSAARWPSARRSSDT